jgi:hypothetical protein
MEKSICFPSRSLGFLAMVESFGLILLDGGFFISPHGKGPCRVHGTAFPCAY